MRMYKIAYTTDQNRKKIDSVEKDLKDLKTKVRQIESDFKKVTREVESLNIGQRRFFQQKSVFTTLQRKIEQFEKVELEWDKFKGTIKDDIKREIEKRHRATAPAKAPLS